jgi:hypothetical protein
MLLELPKQPLVLYISHCFLADFTLDENDVIAHGLKDKMWNEPLGLFETLRAFEHRLVEHYGLPYVDTCAAFRSFMVGNSSGISSSVSGIGNISSSSGENINNNARGDTGDGPCDDIDIVNVIPRNSTSALVNVMLPDTIHQNARMNALQSCIAAHTVLLSESVMRTVGHVPPSGGHQLMLGCVVCASTARHTCPLACGSDVMIPLKCGWWVGVGGGGEGGSF